MPPRRTATTTEEPETTTEEPEGGKSATIEDVKRIVTEALASVTGSSGTTDPETETSTEPEPEEMETPRQTEARMRKAVEAAVGSLHIHVGSEQKTETKKEPEQTPGKPSWLQKFVGLS